MSLQKVKEARAINFTAAHRTSNYTFEIAIFNYYAGVKLPVRRKSRLL